MLDVIEQRVDRLVLKLDATAVPEQATLPSHVQEARRVALALSTSHPSRPAQSVRIRQLGLVAPCTGHLAVGTERRVEEQHTAKRNQGNGLILRIDVPAPAHC